jgi:sRNA-binding carbon storage regulator CsrA
MQISTLRTGGRLEIGDGRTVEVTKIDPHGRWVKLKTIAPEHVTVRAADKDQPAETR